MTRGLLLLLASLALAACGHRQPAPCGDVPPALQLSWYFGDIATVAGNQPAQQAMRLLLLNRGPVPVVIEELRVNAPTAGAPGTWLAHFTPARTLELGEVLQISALELKRPEALQQRFDHCRVPVRASVWLKCPTGGAEHDVELRGITPSALPDSWQHCGGILNTAPW